MNQLNFEVDNNECLYSLKNDSTKTFGKRHVLKDFYDFIKLIVTLGQYTPKKRLFLYTDKHSYFIILKINEKGRRFIKL